MSKGELSKRKLARDGVYPDDSHVVLPGVHASIENLIHVMCSSVAGVAPWVLLVFAKWLLLCILLEQ